MIESKSKSGSWPWYRLHVPTWLALLVTATIMVFAIVPGSRRDLDFLFADDWPHYYLEHGWPWLWLIRDSAIEPCEGAWELMTAIYSFRPARLAADAAVAMVIVLAVGLAIEFWRRSRAGRWWQFSIGELLVITLLAAAASYALVQARDDQNLVAQWDGWVEPRFPRWLREAIGDDRLLPFSFHRPLYSSDRFPPASDEDAAFLAKLVDRFPSQFHFCVYRVERDDASQDEALAPLAPMKRLEILSVSGISDQKFAAMPRLTHLRVLEFSGSGVTDRVFVYLPKLPALEELYLRGTAVKTLNGFDPKKFPSLERIDLTDTEVVESTVERLRAAHPQIRFDWEW